MAANDLSLVITKEFHLAAFVSDLDLFAGRRPDTQRVDDYALFRELLGLGDTAFLEVLSISDQNQNFSGIVFIQREHSLFESNADIGAENRDSLVVDREERFFKGIVIERERALEKSGSGERDQPDAPHAGVMDIIEDGLAGAADTARRYVGGEHAARAIKNEKNIFT